MKTQLKLIRLSKNTIELVKKEAEKQNRSFTNMVETILIERLRK